jgi:hypothetical protein
MLILERLLAHATTPLHLVERTLDMSRFAFLNDATVLGESLALPGNTTSEKLAKHYAECFLMRRLPKMVYEKIVPTSQLEDPELKKEWDAIVERYKFQPKKKVFFFPSFLPSFPFLPSLLLSFFPALLSFIFTHPCSF